MRQLNTRFTALLSIVTLSIGASLAGCGPTPGSSGGGDALPLDAESAALTAKNNVEANLTTLQEAFQTVQEIELFDSAVAQVGAGAAEDMPPVDKAEPGAKPSEAILAFLEEKVMVDEQLESDDGTSVVYLLKADIFCEGLGKSTDLCAEILDAYPLRVAIHLHDRRRLRRGARPRLWAHAGRPDYVARAGPWPWADGV